MNRNLRIASLAMLIGALGAAAPAQIKSFTLEEMATVADNAIQGQITASRVFRVDSARDGDGLFFTRLTIVGRSLSDGRPLTADVTFQGGFLSETEGVFNSEAPSADDVKIGRSVVAFYRWTDDMGGNVAGNALIAAHGGIYRTVDGPRGVAVLGRGEGYAIAANVRAEHLETALKNLYSKKTKR